MQYIFTVNFGPNDELRWGTTLREGADRADPEFKLTAEAPSAAEVSKVPPSLDLRSYFR